jgi:hypothetical protein
MAEQKMGGWQVQVQDVKRGFEGRVKGKVGDLIAQVRDAECSWSRLGESGNRWKERWIDPALG